MEVKLNSNTGTIEIEKKKLDIPQRVGSFRKLEDRVLLLLELEEDDKDENIQRNILCYDANGDKLWQVELKDMRNPETGEPLGFRNLYGFIKPPIFVTDYYIHREHNLETGELLESSDMDKKEISPIRVWKEISPIRVWNKFYEFSLNTDDGSLYDGKFIRKFEFRLSSTEWINRSSEEWAYSFDIDVRDFTVHDWLEELAKDITVEFGYQVTDAPTPDDVAHAAVYGWHFNKEDGTTCSLIYCVGDLTGIDGEKSELLKMCNFFKKKWTFASEDKLASRSHLESL